MDWILFVAIASVTTADKAITTTTVPIASLELCNAAKSQLEEAAKRIQSPNFLIITECLKSR